MSEFVKCFEEKCHENEEPPTFFSQSDPRTETPSQTEYSSNFGRIMKKKVLDPKILAKMLS